MTYFAIANWDGLWPTVRRCDAVPNWKATPPTATVTDGKVERVVSIDWVFDDQWRAHDALADILDRMSDEHRRHAAALWQAKNKGSKRPTRLRPGA